MTKRKTGNHPDLKMVNPNAAAIDVGSTMHMAAVNPDTDTMPVRAFGTFTQDLHDLAAWFRSCGVTSVAMESTGVYWIPAFEILEGHGFEVILVNARYAKNVPGRKTDVSDAGWLRQLHSYGLLRGSFRPEAEIATLRAYMRQRERLTEYAAAQIAADLPTKGNGQTLLLWPISRSHRVSAWAAIGLPPPPTRPGNHCPDRPKADHALTIKLDHSGGADHHGRPKMTEELKELGLNICHRRVGRLMRENGIRVERSKKYKVTTDSIHAFNIAPNLLNRDFRADQPNQKWAGDISYVWTREGWLCLAVILDLHSRRIIGLAVSNRMKRDLAIRALKMAVALRQPPKGCIHHTDRGSQYCSHDYQKLMRQRGFKVSMSGKGNSYDNSTVETFFKTINAELIWRRSWQTRGLAEAAIFQYINGFYNPRRRHSALGWKNPVAFERKVA